MLAKLMYVDGWVTIICGDFMVLQSGSDVYMFTICKLVSGLIVISHTISHRTTVGERICLTHFKNMFLDVGQLAYLYSLDHTVNRTGELPAMFINELFF